MNNIPPGEMARIDQQFSEMQNMLRQMAKTMRIHRQFRKMSPYQSMASCGAAIMRFTQDVDTLTILIACAVHMLSKEGEV